MRGASKGRLGRSSQLIRLAHVREQGGTCRSMLFPESEYYASDPGLLKRMYHSMSLMFKDEADGASAGGSGKLLVYGGDNGVNRLGDVWTWSPGARVSPLRNLTRL